MSEAVAGSGRSPWRHGTIYGYRDKGCRCDFCEDANRQARNRWRNDQDRKHLTCASCGRSGHTLSTAVQGKWQCRTCRTNHEPTARDRAWARKVWRKMNDSDRMLVGIALGSESL